METRLANLTLELWQKYLLAMLIGLLGGLQ